MITLLGAFITGGFSAFKAVRKNKADEIKQAGELKASISTAKRKRVAQGDASAGKLDEINLSDRGWKDEYLLLITTAPLILSFIPDYAKYVDLGFTALKSVPEHYWYCLAMVYIDTFGFRRMLRVAVEHWLSKKYRVA
ncbi:hypothetical protein [Psychromonas sp. Urea-02u-13]|uniref:hypothetical protein n=1 Tax=Psychromonas sp. Urea-02u-13 TaxID=2058326 RepID=UPI000C31CE59|nr:hypothetical protein [Psychromonas sp. Urea-02u-13]PKG39698.1 hypothetical protein CXF74_07030 [Psychromonas sp. Urea-02u-13]